MGSKVIWAALSGTIALAGLFPPLLAQVRQFDIPSEEAGKSLPEFGHQAGVQVLAPGEWLHGVVTPEVKGFYDVSAALELMLKGTGLVASRSPDGIIAISIRNKKSNDSEGKDMPQNLKSGTSILALILTALTAPPAHAQSNADTIETVTVTATRFDTNAQKTPVALNVYTGDVLQTQNITSVNALASIDPSVNMTLNTGSAIVGMRGVQSSNNNEVSNPAVSVAHDGFFMNRTYSILTSFYDLARVEVLKGPQGTLFGRNSLGGMINIISAKPDLGNFGGYGLVNFGDYNLVGVEGAVNIPVTDTLAVRVSGFGEYRDGYRKVTVANFRGDDSKVVSGRAQAYWVPAEWLDALVTYQRDDVGGYGDTPANGPSKQPFAGDPHSFPGYYPDKLRIDTDRVTGVLNVHLPFGLTATYTGGMDVTKYFHALDVTGDPASISSFDSTEHVRVFNHELRVATAGDERLTVQGGIFLYQEHNLVTSGNYVRSGVYNGNALIMFNYDVHQTSLGIFGQAGYAITPELTLTIGARYTWDHISRFGGSYIRCDVGQVPLYLCSGNPPVLVFPNSTSKMAQSRPNFHFGLDYQITDNNMVYVKFDSAYKTGAFTQDPVNPNIAFPPETVTAVEVGTKNTFLDGKVTANLDLFRSIDDHQCVNDVSGSLIFCHFAMTLGAEFQVVARLTSDTRFDLNGTALQNKINGNAEPIPDGTNGYVLTPIAKHFQPNSPAMTLVAGMEHDFNVGGGVLTARMDGKYMSPYYSELFNFIDMRSPATLVGNARLTWSPEGSKWQVAAYIKNFSDEVVYARIGRNSITTAEAFEFQAPRTVGAQIKYRY